MTTGFKVGTVDLDDWFDPYLQGTKPGLTGYRVGAQDLRDRFAPRASGSAAPVTHFKISNGADLNTLFAAKGSATYPLGFSDNTYLNQAALSAYVAFNFTSTSAWAITGHGAVTGGPLSGSLATYGAVTQFYLSDVAYSTQSATVDTAPQNSWQPITTGLEVIRYRTLGLTGNAVNASCRLRFRNAEGTILSDSRLLLQVNATSPQ